MLQNILACKSRDGIDCFLGENPVQAVCFVVFVGGFLFVAFRTAGDFRAGLLEMGSENSCLFFSMCYQVSIQCFLGCPELKGTSRVAIQ